MNRSAPRVRPSSALLLLVLEQQRAAASMQAVS